MADAIDALTGMLAGESLPLRARELAHQSRRCGEPVAVLVGELDASSPDARGRQPGLLREVAEALLDRLRAFDLAYRVGGDRFVVLLPGADHERAAHTAERLRHGLEAAQLGGEPGATMSFGVGASREGWAFDYDTVRLEAESALASAAASGGNVVCCGTGRALSRAPLPGPDGVRGALGDRPG
jgi:diguanylate cyclase (GGDEF)-like protein